MDTSRFISNTKGQGPRVHFGVGLDWKKEEERTSSGCASRRERKQRKRQNKMAFEAETQKIHRQMAHAFRILKEGEFEGRLLKVWNEPGGANGVFGTMMAGFLRAVGVPEPKGAIQNKLAWFRATNLEFNNAFLDRRSAYDFLRAFCGADHFRKEFGFESDPQPSSSEDESLHLAPLDLADNRGSDTGESRAEYVVENEADAAGAASASGPSDRGKTATEQDKTKTAAAPANHGSKVIANAAVASAAAAGASNQEDTVTEQDEMKETAVVTEPVAKKQKTVGWLSEPCS
jgi:hypothetical protein